MDCNYARAFSLYQTQGGEPVVAKEFCGSAQRFVRAWPRKLAIVRDLILGMELQGQTVSVVCSQGIRSGGRACSEVAIWV